MKKLLDNSKEQVAQDLLTIIEIGKREVEQGKFRSAKKVIAKIRRGRRV